MTQSEPPRRSSTWTIVLILVGVLILAALMRLVGLPLPAQFAGAGILIVVAAVVWYVWRRSTGGR